MSGENVEIARQVFPAPVEMVAVFENADLLAATRQVIEPLVHPEFETFVDRDAIAMGPGIGIKGGPPGLVAIGVNGFIAFWRDWLTAWETWSVGEQEFIELDADRVLSTYDARARSKTAQVEVDFHPAHLMTFRDGRVTRVELFLNRVDAMEAAGLSG